MLSFVELEKKAYTLFFQGHIVINQTHYLNWEVPGDDTEAYLGTWDLKCYLESLKLGCHLVKSELRESHISDGLQVFELITSGTLHY